VPSSFYAGIKMKQVDDSVNSLRSKELKQIAAAFSGNVDDLHAMLTLPLGLMNIGLWEADRMHFLSNAVNGMQRSGKNLEGSRARNKAIAEANRQFDKGALSPASKVARSQMVDIAATMLHNLINNKNFDQVRFATRALFYASISSAWGMFECVARDTWIAALNSHPTPLAQGALAKIQDAGVEDRLSSKQISVGLIARHGFDLRRKMGALLAPKFDFTSISGIRGAYSDAFRDEPSIAQALSDPVLGQLEAARHLIVHRAGWVDEEYQRRIGTLCPLGTRLLVDGKMVSALTNAAINASGTLLYSVDSWMIKNPARRRS
jgi:hypothetical protein